MRLIPVLIALGLWGCSGDSPPAIDADPNGPKCTQALYDVCATEHDCMSAMCHLFMADGFQVCTQACTVGDNTSCPQPVNGTATCNNMGICKPSAANACHL
jgi:hypothetical protein